MSLFNDWKNIILGKIDFEALVKETTLARATKRLILSIILVGIVSGISNILLELFVYPNTSNDLNSLVSQQSLRPISIALGIDPTLFIIVFYTITIFFSIILTLISTAIFVKIWDFFTKKFFSGQGVFRELLGGIFEVDAAIQGTLIIVNIITLITTILVVVLSPNLTGLAIFGIIGLFIALFSFIIAIYNIYLNLKILTTVHKISMTNAIISYIGTLIFLFFLLIIPIVIMLIVVGLLLQVTTSPTGLFSIPF